MTVLDFLPRNGIKGSFKDDKPSLDSNRLDGGLHHRGVLNVEKHAIWMKEALALARTMQGRVWPNPAVGCVIVKDGVVVGRGRTQIGGRPHAERVALDDAGDRANGATLYVTLEPCCHWGKTPPCTDAIIAAGIAAVYAALQDPDLRVNGEGFARLQAAGIDVHVGLGARAAERVMRGFFTRVATGRPLVSVLSSTGRNDRVASTFDGVLMTGEAGQIRLLTRQTEGFRKEHVILEDDPALLLGHCGALGLTSVFLMIDDPLVPRLRSAGLIDSLVG